MLIEATEGVVYSFTVLRYVHDVVAREFLNVGIVIYLPESGELKVKTQKSISRLSGAFPDIEAPAFRKAMRAVDRGIARLGEETSLVLPPGTQPDARRLALRVLPEDDSSLQWSRSGGGLTTDVDGTLDRLFKRFVTQHDGTSTERLTDRDLWGQVRTKLAERNLDVQFQQRSSAARSTVSSLKTHGRTDRGTRTNHCHWTWQAITRSNRRCVAGAGILQQSTRGATKTCNCISYSVRQGTNHSPLLSRTRSGSSKGHRLQAELSRRPRPTTSST